MRISTKGGHLRVITTAREKTIIRGTLATAVLVGPAVAPRYADRILEVIAGVAAVTEINFVVGASK